MKKIQFSTLFVLFTLSSMFLSGAFAATACAAITREISGYGFNTKFKLFNRLSQSFPIFSGANWLRENRLAANDSTHFAKDVLDSRGMNLEIAQGTLDSITETDRPLIIAANHGSGFFEALAILKLALSKRSGVKILGIGRGPVTGIDEYLFKIQNPDEPKRKSAHRAALKAMIQHMHDGGALIIFPSGSIAANLQADGRYTEPEFKDTFVSLARKTGADILPIFIETKNSKFFYRFRDYYYRHYESFGAKALGSFYNFLLVREFATKKNQTYQVKIGELIHADSFEGKSNSDIAAEIQQVIYGMR
ncbi:MAG: hypothetical protein J0L93_08160 [Deltaproteobacteria bacterium]|nr:hypothetical protein [Deltaproteobacteria bacterium]